MSEKRPGNVFSVFNFKKKKVESVDGCNSIEITKDILLPDGIEVYNPNLLKNETGKSTSLSMPALTENEIYKNDIACFIMDRTLKKSEIVDCLKHIWIPPLDFSFPENIEGKQKRKFQHKYLTQYSWLAYSNIHKGAYCKFCVLFAFSGGGVGRQNLGKLVTAPMLKFKDAKNDFNKHSKTEYHLLSVQRANDFLINFENGCEKTVDVLFNKHLQQTIESNKKRLIPIVKTILFCARNNLPLRGHRETGSLSLESVRSSCIGGEQGVLRALLAFRVDSGDTELQRHFETSPKNCTMISPIVQNEIIDVIGGVIVGKIVDRVKQFQFFSLLCDETTDISTIEQMTVCIRYVDTSSWILREDFLGFVKMTSTTGLAIKDAILLKLKEVGLSLDNLRGQGYDGGANMSGKHNGVQSLILKEQPLAFYTHCFSHSLNLCLSKACNVSSIKNMMGIVSSIAAFFSASAKRADKLKSVILGDSNNSQKKEKLKTLCETRWIERHDALITFKQLYVYVVHALEDISHDPNPESACKAALYLNSVTKIDFIVALEVTVTCFAYTLQLSISLQSKQQDISKALSDVMIIRSALEELREGADEHFKHIFKDVSDIANLANVEICMPRICGRQTQRININSKDPETYFKVSVFLPFLDFILQELDARFNQRLSDIIPLQGLIPSNFSMYDDATILKAASVYAQDLSTDDNSILKAELRIWRHQWRNKQIKPESAIDTLPHCTAVVPNIKILLQLFATLPVTSATPERTFSALKRLKTYLRSTMSEERLNGLALTNINKKELLSEDEIIKLFSQKAPRRMQLEDWSK